MRNFGLMGFTGGWQPFALILLAWALFWKGLALWHSARRGEGLWFVVLLVLNTVGILEIVYLFLIAKVKTDELFPTKTSKKKK